MAEYVIGIELKGTEDVNEGVIEFAAVVVGG